MFTTNNSFNLLIGKSISRTATVQITDPSTTTTYIADGEIVVLDSTDTPMTAGTTFSQSHNIRIVQRSGGTATNPTSLVQSARINGQNMIAYTGLSYTAPQEQIWSFGFNGTSGSIDVTGVDDFVFRLSFLEDKTIWSHYSNTRIFRQEPAVTNTEQKVADYFAQVISDDAFSKSEVTVERLINATTGTDAANFVFTRGSKIAVASVAATVVAGDYIKVGTGVTKAAYKVVSISGLNYTLDQAAQTSVSATTPDYVLSATAATSSFGVKFTGLAQTFTVGKFKYVKVHFNFSLAGFGATTVTKTQESFKGSGTGEEVAELEFMSVGFDGAIDKFWDSAPTGRTDAVSTANYDIIAIEYFVSFDALPVSGAKPARQILFIAVVDGAAQTTNLLAQLNPWMNSIPQAFNYITV